MERLEFQMKKVKNKEGGQSPYFFVTTSPHILRAFKRSLVCSIIPLRFSLRNSSKGKEKRVF